MKASHFALGFVLALGSGGTVHAQEVAPPPVQLDPQDTQDTPLSVDVTNAAAKDMVLMIPALPTSAVTATAAGSTDELGRKLAQIIDDDLRNTGLFKTQGPGQAGTIAYSEVNAPNYGLWAGRSAQALVQGYVRASGNGQLTVGCYLYDVALQTELVRKGFVVSPATGAAPRINAPTRSTPASPARAPISTARSSMSPNRVPRSAASRSRSWIRMAPITAS
jgi:TolB protein